MRFPSTKAFIDLTTERMYRYPLTLLADRVSTQTNVYTYRYDYQPPAVRLLGLGAFHATEIPVLFDSGLKLGPVTLKITNSREAQSVGRAMRTAWGNFAKTGTPGEDWPQYDTASRKTMVIDKTCTAMDDPFGARMALYQTYVSPWKVGG